MRYECSKRQHLKVKILFKTKKYTVWASNLKHKLIYLPHFAVTPKFSFVYT